MVNQAKTSISEEFPSGWLYVQGLLFVVVILFLPRGVGGAVETLRNYVGPRMPQRKGGRPRVAGRAAPATAATEEVA